MAKVKKLEPNKELDLLLSKMSEEELALIAAKFTVNPVIETAADLEEIPIKIKVQPSMNKKTSDALDSLTADLAIFDL